MAVFRVEKTQGYTVMSNHHLRNKELTAEERLYYGAVLSYVSDSRQMLNGGNYELPAAPQRSDFTREAAEPPAACAGRSLHLCRKLADARMRDEAHRIAEVFGNLKEPNSPNKKQFMVELSPAFLLLASSKDTERLQAMLPYKSLSLSSIKDRRAFYSGNSSIPK